MKNTYDEIRDDLKWVADALEDSGFHDIAVYNKGTQYNVKDLNGITQTFYPTTGTMVFHRSDDRKDHAIKSLHNGTLEEFTQYLSEPERIQGFFTKE